MRKTTRAAKPVSTTDDGSLVYDGSPSTLGDLKVSDVASRIKIGRSGAMSKFARLDKNAIDRFRDPSMTALGGVSTTSDDEDDDNGDMADIQKIGPSPKLTTSLYTKAAAIANKYPDFRATIKPGAPPEASEAPTVARTKFRRLWKEGNWQRIARKATIKEYVSGMGFVAWFWDSATRLPMYEHVQPKDLSVDPCTTDWQNLRFAARLIRMPLREARKKYPKYYATQDAGAPPQNQGGKLDSTKVKIWLYWDKNAEVHMLENGWHALKITPNRYGRVPILVTESVKVDPGYSVFSLGDGILAAGSQQEIEDIQGIISNKAKHNGPVTTYNSRLLTDPKALEDARDGQWLPSPDLTEPVVQRISGEPIEQAEIEALRLAGTSQDQLLGVNDAMRGALASGNPTATEVSIVATQSGANSSDAKANYELFVSRWADTCLFMLQEFGGPEAGVKLSPEEIREYELLKWIEEVCVQEASTLYRDPNADLQQSQTLLQQAINSSEIYLSFAQLGVSFGGQQPVIPNLKAYQDKVLRASGVESVEDFWIPAPPPPQQPQENDADVLIKALQTIYQYSPADIQRQIEHQFGLTPSELGGTSPPEIAAATPQKTEAAKSEPNPEMEIARQEDEQHHDAAMQSAKHGHDLRMQILKGNQQKELERMRLQHNAQLKLAEMQHQSRQQAEQAKVQSEQQKAQLAAQEKTTRLTVAARPTVKPSSNGKGK